MGGMIAQALAVSHPAQVSRLILASTAVGTGKAVPLPPFATVPGVNFGDPLGSADPLSAGDRAPADVPAVPQDLDTPTANGSEPAS